MFLKDPKQKDRQTIEWYFFSRHFNIAYENGWQNPDCWVVGLPEPYRDHVPLVVESKRLLTQTPSMQEKGQ